MFCNIFSGSLERISCNGNDISKRKTITFPTDHSGNSCDLSTNLHPVLCYDTSLIFLAQSFEANGKGSFQK